MSQVGNGGLTSDVQAHAAFTPLWSVAGLALATTVALGFARFAYGLILPAMRADLHLTYANAGVLNTVNSAGYLATTLAAPWLARRFGHRAVFSVGMFGTALALLACGFTRNFALLSVLRLVAGAAGACAFVLGGALVAAGRYGIGGRASSALSIYVGGGGLGIAVSALTVPWALAHSGWQMAWLVLGLFSLAASILSVMALRHIPLPAVKSAQVAHWSARPMLALLASYAMFGVGYIIYVTFIIVYLRNIRHFSDAGITGFWLVLGLTAMLASFVWGAILSRLRAGWGAVATNGLSAAGAALPLLSASPIAAYLSAILFGAAFLAVVAAVTTFARRAAPPFAWTRVISLLTVCFGVGQVIGPYLAGRIADGPGGMSAGIGLAAGFLALGAGLAMFQQHIVHEHG